MESGSVGSNELSGDSDDSNFRRYHSEGVSDQISLPLPINKQLSDSSSGSCGREESKEFNEEVSEDSDSYSSGSSTPSLNEENIGKRDSLSPYQFCKTKFSLTECTYERHIERKPYEFGTRKSRLLVAEKYTPFTLETEKCAPEYPMRLFKTDFVVVGPSIKGMS